MWIFAGDTFLSIVAHEQDPRLLHVRARIPGDIERLFPEADVAETPHGDYRFRASLAKDRVVDTLARRIRAIDYTSFVDAVDPSRLPAYDRAYQAMVEEQMRHGDESTVEVGNPPRVERSPATYPEEAQTLRLAVEDEA